ncbi:hypothetical protein PIB30_050564 [Stylosanthes scabra]|uniref:Reverse transcriptase zinc-binding domain-containing protein n=1 Tax=Stylosanthes scabra TaxID=79078 RepID=A0ABU6RHW3_9FABA|nr:hypothetical protein [Stylosanthes scabra]
MPAIATEILYTRIEDNSFDMLTWAPKKRGSYSVALGYKIAFQLFHPPVELLPKQCCRKELWSSVWDLRCPPKMPQFGETVVRCLNQCPFAAEVWNLSEFHEVAGPDSSSNFWQWWLRVINDLKRTSQWRRRASTMATIIWKLWVERNQRIFEGLSVSSVAVLSSAIEMIQEYHNHHPP